MRYKTMQNKYVFVDWFEIEAGYGKAFGGYKPKNASPYGIELKVHKPIIDMKPVIISDKPWECMRAGAYASFIKVGDVYKCWYDAYTTPDDYHMFWCYAESKDGINWEKPDLGLFEYKGSKHNNIIDDDNRDHGYSVIYDEDAPCDEKYKMVFTRITKDENGNRQVFTMKAYSKDGIHWNKYEEPLCIGGDTQLCLIKWNGKYIIYSKGQGELDVHRRTITYLESYDFKTFTEPVFIKYNNPLDAPDVDYYTINAVKWPGSNTAFLSLYPKYHRSFDNMDIYIQTSREGRVYHDVSLEPYIGNDLPPFDKMLMPSTGVIDMANGKWSFFFANSDYTHNDPYDIRTYPASEKCGFYRAEIREDGFVSVHADAIGSFHTQALYPSGNSIFINCDYNLGGYVKAEIFDDKEDKLLEGFEIENCNLIESGKTWQEITWKSGKKISDLDKNKRYRIHFEMKNADIYAYKF